MTKDQSTLALDVITDYLAGAERQPMASSTVRFPRRRLPLSELVRIKVMQDIHAYNERKSAVYGAEYLEPDEYAAACREGTELLGAPLKKGKVNPAIELRHAMRALKEGRFKVVIDGRDLTDPDADVVLKDDSTVVFVRRVPFA